MTISRDRRPKTPRIDLISTAFALGICLLFLVGLSTLASAPVAILGSVGLAGAIVVALRMMALPDPER
ncbi:hypothetical protein ACFYU5_27200 [Nocardia aobensis]|uniref:Uncharacterized protein n=1 Tax=Nocardia aobensis TaxID=257277 RepID=A0ABW6PAF2_9NOCA